jgi:general secretion pathway protein D
VAQQPITSFNYQDIGVNIDITPRTHHDDEVSLTLKLEVSAISGTGYGGLPTFANRSINTVIRLRDGETNLLAGLIRDDERQVLAGVPGLSDMPIVGRLFAHNKRETLETDIVMTLTPRIVRVLELTEADLRPFRVGRDGDGAGVLELPIPAVIPPAGGRPPVPPGGAPTPAPPPDAKPGTPAPVQPITPPPAR